MARRLLVAGNWKMNTDASSARDLARSVAAGLVDPAVDVLLVPPFPFIDAVVSELSASGVTHCSVGAQDLHPEDSGAFTGAVSGPQIASTGASWVLVGHSERRHVFGDHDELVRRKLLAAARCGLQPILCVGERLPDREAGRGTEVVLRQLRTALEDWEGPSPIVAYEPVWAIGTGRTATSDVAQSMHAAIRAVLPDLNGRILYGGSVKPSNAASLMSQPDVDGVLVGGASLDPKSFLSIVQAALSTVKS